MPANSMLPFYPLCKPFDSTLRSGEDVTETEEGSSWFTRINYAKWKREVSHTALSGLLPVK